MRELLFLGLIFLILFILFLIVGYIRYQDMKAKKEFLERQEKYKKMI